MDRLRYSPPIGIGFLECLLQRRFSRKSCKILVLIITFFAYTSYHATRKTTSIVKSVLDPEKSHLNFFPWSRSYSIRLVDDNFQNSGEGKGWAPFNGSDGNAMLGSLDIAFLLVYSFGMYFAGHLGDRLNLRIFLTVGMLGTALFTALFGAGYWLGIHSFYYYLLIQMLAGLFQSTGWPSVVAVMGKWYSKRRRGLIMGIWNAHTSVGNISGSLIASALLEYGWGWSFAVPALVMAFVGLVVLLFLPVSPEEAGAERRSEQIEAEIKDEQTKPHQGSENTEPLLQEKVGNKHDAIGFWEAWRIPGVAQFAVCLFFSKLVAYTFLYWLPFYISHTAINGQYLSSSTSGFLSTVFDVGGVVGGALAGYVSDKFNSRAFTVASAVISSIPALLFYRTYGSISLFWNSILMFVAGMFVNGPYALITTAVSVDLGTHGSLRGNSRALATVTGIIDGTGSVGAALGPFLTGYISQKSWDAVFYMLMAAALLAAIVLSRVLFDEVKAKMAARQQTISGAASRTVVVV